MLSKALYDYLQQECNAVLDSHSILQERPSDPRAIHAMRVSTKKLRAFFALVKQLPGYTFGAGKHLRDLKLIQKIGGAARDTHLQEIHLKRYERKIKTRFSHAHLLLKTRQDTAIEMLTATVKHLSLKNFKTLPQRFHKAIADIDKDQAMATIINYLDQQRQDVSMPASNAHHEAWHAERKKVKTIYYQLTVVDEVLPINYGSKKLITEMHKGGELLGQWHDTSVLLHYIKQLVSWQKKERVNLPVNAHKLVLLIQTDEKEHLALATRQLRKLVINQEASPQ